MKVCQEAGSLCMTKPQPMILSNVCSLDNTLDDISCSGNFRNCCILFHSHHHTARRWARLILYQQKCSSKGYRDVCCVYITTGLVSSYLSSLSRKSMLQVMFPLWVSFTLLLHTVQHIMMASLCDGILTDNSGPLKRKGPYIQHISFIQWFHYLNSVNTATLAEGDPVLSFVFACTPCNTNPNAVCQVQAVTFMVLLDLWWYIASLGISHMSLSSTVRLSPAALDRNLIYSEVGEGWYHWRDSDISHQWKWMEACKIEFTILRRTLGCKRLCMQVTFPAQPHLVLPCWPLVNGNRNPSIRVGISSSSIVAPSAS